MGAPKKLLLLILLACCLSGCPSSQDKSSALGGLPLARDDLKSGEPARDFSLKDLSGTEHKLSDYRGKLVLLNFWATWCAPCIVEMPALQELQQRFPAEKFAVLTISVDAEREVLQKFIEESDLKLTVLHDPTMKTISHYHVEGFPESVFVGPDGRLVAVVDPLSGSKAVRILSDRPWNDTRYLALVKQLLAEHIS